MRSKTRTTRGAAPSGERLAPGGPPAAPARHGQARAAADPEAFGPPAGSDSEPEPQTAPARPPSRRALRNWRVRSRLVLLIAIPTLTAIILGGIRIGASAQAAVADQRVERLATLSGQVASFANALEAERLETTRFIVMGSDTAAGGPSDSGRGQKTNTSDYAYEQGVLHHVQAQTDHFAAEVRDGASQIGSSYAPLIQQEAQNAITAISGLKALRAAATTTALPALSVINEYDSTINQVLALNDEIATGSNDSTLADSVRVLGLVSRMKEEASEQGAILMSALNSDQTVQGDFGPEKLSALNDAVTEEKSNQAEFGIAASTPQKQLFQTAMSTTHVIGAQAQRDHAIEVAQSGQQDPTIASAATAMTYPVQGLRSVEANLVASISSRAAALRNDAITSAVIVGIAIAIVLILALAFTTIVGRSMVRPLRRLRAGALEVAGIRLPETVRRMSEADGEDVPLDVEPIDVDSNDEIGEVARAFDQVHREALRLAANEAALRGNVNAMFVNLSRRSQSLVERQIQLIDELELGEQDAERLSSLFQMDHLATRMRRNSENLLVLAGHDVSRRRNQPVALVDVLRAAVSEIEQYERVTLNVQPGISVRGPAVNDVVHLISELAENATSFSSAETPVNVSGHLLNSGGVLLDITDQGVGMGAEEMAHANWRLDNPPVVDVAVSRRMGLFVVARLAARHGIRVRLRPAASGGLTALVWLPDEAVTHDGDTPRRSPAEAVAPGGGTSAFSGFATASPAPAGSVAGVFSTGEWGAADRSPAEEAVTAARTPRFAPLRADEDDARRDEGENGSALPFRTAPAPAGEPARPAFGGGHASPSGIPPEQVPASAQESYSARQDLFAPVTPPGTAAPVRPEPAAPAAFTNGDVTAPSGPQSVFGAPPAGGASGVQDRPVSPGNGLGARGWTPGSSAAGAAGSSGAGQGGNGGVVVPPPAALGEEHRLPIFEAVESDWFRRGRHAVSPPSPGAEPEEEPTTSTWTSPADEGWRAAQVVSAPTSGGLTSAGL
ncbi:MAG TPA: nitrate- and nitrite sensing domain-containing protein, partial [Streptosporangiaceae bacterium]|nr:nitrate- and nitrite sensing domain-containing protein [Streptosporangiaceae bacterium]